VSRGGERRGDGPQDAQPLGDGPQDDVPQGAQPRDDGLRDDGPRGVVWVRQLAGQ
jgi:hypothetical protein